MTVSKKIIPSVLLAVAVAMPVGVTLAATLLTKEQITQEVTKTHPGSMIEKAAMEQVKGKEVWVVNLKDKQGKPHTLHYDATTGKPM